MMKGKGIGNILQSSPSEWAQHFTGFSRRGKDWSVDLLVYHVFWLEIFLLVAALVVAGWLLYGFVFAQTEDVQTETLPQSELLLSTLTDLQKWQEERAQQYQRELEVSAEVFGER